MEEQILGFVRFAGLRIEGKEAKLSFDIGHLGLEALVFCFAQRIDLSGRDDER